MKSTVFAVPDEEDVDARGVLVEDGAIIIVLNCPVMGDGISAWDDGVVPCVLLTIPAPGPGEGVCVCVGTAEPPGIVKPAGGRAQDGCVRLCAPLANPEPVY